MRNFTSKMKSVLFSIFAILTMATPSQAQVSDVADLFGKYKFTATIEYTELGKAKGFEGKFKSESDVVFGKSDNKYVAGIMTGLLGIENQPVKMNVFDEVKQTLELNEPNGNTAAWGNLVSSFLDGTNPYKTGVMYFPVYTYNAADGTISIPDFSLGTVANYATSETMDVYAKITNAKLTPVELDNKPGISSDFAGNWHFVADEYGAMADSPIPAEFDMTLLAKDANHYDATLTIGTYAPVTIEAVATGNTLTLKINNTYIDKENNIMLLAGYGAEKVGDVKFELDNQNLKIQGFITVKDITKEGAPIQYYGGGFATKTDAPKPTFDITGRWHFTADPAGSMLDSTLPDEFDLDVVAAGDAYKVNFILAPYAPVAIDATFADNVLTLQLNNTYVDKENNIMLLAGYGAVQVGNITFKVEEGKLVIDDFLSIKDITKEGAPLQYFGMGSAVKVEAPKPASNLVGKWHLVADPNTTMPGSPLPEEFDMSIDAINDSAYQVIFSINPYNPVKIDAVFADNVLTLKLNNTYLDKENNVMLLAGYGAAQVGNVTFNYANGELSMTEYLVIKDITKEGAPIQFFSAVKATKVAEVTGIEEVKQNAANVCVSGSIIKLDNAQPVQVYNLSGQCVFNGVTSEVSGLAKGLYVVKTANGATKVLVK